MKFKPIKFMLLLVLLSTIIITGCTKLHSPKIATKVKRGYLPFEAVKVGIPEETVKRAIFSYSVDHPGCLGGKVQYLSRIWDKFGGQYVIQCKNGQVFELQVYHLDKPVSQDIALATMRLLVPLNLKQNPILVENRKRAKQLSDVYDLGTAYSGELVYAGNDRKNVNVINAWINPKAALKD